MALCVNIFALTKSMTRVEKYRRYREEISNMKFENFTQKKEASGQVEKIRNTDFESKLNYDEVMEIHEVYEENDEKVKKTKFMPLTKYEIVYSLIAILLFVIILLALIFTGRKIWG